MQAHCAHSSWRPWGGALTGSRDGESLFDFRALGALSASVRDERGPHACNTRRKRAGGTGEARIAR